MLAQQYIEQPQDIAPLADAKRINVVVKAVTRVAEAWQLTNAEAASLFDVPIATWNRMKAGTYKGNLDQDKMMRASLIIGIFKGLRFCLMAR